LRQALIAASADCGNYWPFMLTSKRQSRELITMGHAGNTLKAIDEWNYCHLSKEWI
jgi:hypothetical protein